MEESINGISVVEEVPLVFVEVVLVDVAFVDVVFVDVVFVDVVFVDVVFVDVVLVDTGFSEEDSNVSLSVVTIPSVVEGSSVSAGAETQAVKERTNTTRRNNAKNFVFIFSPKQKTF